MRTHADHYPPGTPGVLPIPCDCAACVAKIEYKEAEQKRTAAAEIECRYGTHPDVERERVRQWAALGKGVPPYRYRPENWELDEHGAPRLRASAVARAAENDSLDTDCAECRAWRAVARRHGVHVEDEPEPAKALDRYIIGLQEAIAQLLDERDAMRAKVAEAQREPKRPAWVRALLAATAEALAEALDALGGCARPMSPRPCGKCVSCRGRAELNAARQVLGVRGKRK